MADNETYVATEPLFIGRARAHNAGDVVPFENIGPNGWQDDVVKATTKAGREALGLSEDAAAADVVAAAQASSATRP